MMNKAKKTSRIGLAFVGITAGFIGLFTPIASASGDRPQTDVRTVRVITTPQPTKAMYAAVRRCAPAPKNVRQACHSLYLRPASDRYPAGKAIVAECHGQATQEAKDYPGPRTWADYFRGCVLGNIETP